MEESGGRVESCTLYFALFLHGSIATIREAACIQLQALLRTNNGLPLVQLMQFEVEPLAGGE